ncbi:MAG: DNA repair protein RecN [Hyphomonadaceae bacterium]|nr:DNA repair protein RecN [Hyphomonadaceae bacterium]
MLTGLSIRDFVLVRALDLDLGGGFTALTGETGAGKSILMSALGFALGARAGQGLIRPGAEAASVTASFEAPVEHPVRALLAARGVEEAPDEPLVFRRMVKRGGAARAFLNDKPVSAGLLEEAGGLLADIHGQHEGLGLLNTARHRSLLDAYAKADDLLKETARTWTALRCAEEARAALEARIARAAAERTWLAHALEELDALDPQEGETQRLALDRATMQAGERVAEAIDAAAHLLTKANVESALANAGRAVSRALSAPGLNGEAAGSDLAARVRAACESLERALIEAGEARAALDSAAASCEFSPAALEASETRLFALRAAGRKHDVDPDQLAGLHKRLRLQLDEIEHSDSALAATIEAETKARAAYDEAAGRLTARREAAAKKLAKAVSAELPPLKLEKSKFRIAVSPREPGPLGRDDVAFEIETNPGAGFGSLDRIASGGEMARFALAVSLCLAGSSPAGTLVFDEADMGVGGAVAAAIGERLARLGRDKQVLAITHSPQVAAAGARQLKVSKADAGGEIVASVDALTQKARKEEIARMLAGASVTKEARAAAGRLLAGA